MSDPPRVWKTGERCQLTVGNRTVSAVVLLASGNGLSLVVQFEALLAGHVGGAPLLWDPALQGFVSIRSGHEFVLTDPLPEARA